MAGSPPPVPRWWPLPATDPEDGWMGERPFWPAPRSSAQSLGLAGRGCVKVLGE